jgi:hypothetical protein
LRRWFRCVEVLIKKTHSSRLEFEKKYAKAVRNLGKGEFRLNVVDPNGPMLTPLTEEEKLVRKGKRSAFDISTTVPGC